MENTIFSFFVRENRRRGIRDKFVRVMASVVVFCTTYSLILPALTMQSDTYCGTQEHAHSEACYICADTAPQLQCGDAMQIHEHTDSCRDAAGNLACGFADFVLHTHDSLCYNDADELICTLPQHMPHVHSDACYESAVHSHGDSCYEIQRGDLLCSLEETEGHTHADGCYGPKEVLLCTAPETEGHTHGENCYQTDTALGCGMESHPHSDSCYSAPVLLCAKGEHTHNEECHTDGSLTCTAEEHYHGSDCYSQKELVCGQESHPHTDACYTQTRTLVCGEEECEAHTHGDGCYGHPLICRLEEIQGHLHTDACYAEIKTLVCQLEETAAEPELVCGKAVLQAHTHTDSCRDENGNLICGLLEVAEHTHTEACLAEAEQAPLTCTLAEDENHQHGQMCYGTWVLACEEEVHIHNLSCYSNPEADVETEEIWKRTFASVDLTGSFADDLAAIANTQNGYTESNRNYRVQEDGIHISGYTRYGAWAGEPYADWNAHFVAFCVNYARIPEAVLPTAASARLWAEALSDEYYDLYYDAEKYEPKTGDLIFLHISEFEEETAEETETANFMGIVLSCTDTAVTYIAGDSDKQVRVDVLPLDDAALLGYGQVFALPMMTTLEESANDLGSVVTVNCLNVQSKSTDTYAGLEPFELRISYYSAMQAGQTYTLTLDQYFAAETVDVLWGDCPVSYDAETRTIRFTPSSSQSFGGELSVKGTIASYSGDEALTVNPVSGNSKAVAITQDPAQLTYTETIGGLTVTVEVLEPNPAGSMSSVTGIQLTPVLPTDSMYQSVLSGEKRVIGDSRIYEHQMFTVQFVDASGNVVEGLDLSSRNVTFTIAGTDSMKGMGAEGTELHAFYRAGNTVNEVITSQEGSAVYEISGSALTENAFLLDVITVNPNELGEGSYDEATFGYNNMRDAFIHDPKYADYYNEDSPLGTAGSFHLVAFGDAYLNSHTNGNILAYNLYANNNFGSNQKDGFDGFTELHYVQNYKTVNATSSARSSDILVVGSDNTMGVQNGNEFVINDVKIGKPKNVIQDDDTNTAPFIDLHRVESEIRAISANLGSYEEIKETDEFIIATEADHPYLEIQDKDNIGVWNATPDEIKALKEKGRGLAMKGFESDGSGAIIVNVDMSSWPDNQILELPDARVYVDGQQQSVSETLDFSAGKVIWNFTNADGKQIKTNIMTGMVVAPGATVTIGQNLNGTVVAENIDVQAESHRTDFVGKIYKNEFRTDAHIHIHKVDKGNFGKLLSGAEFILEKYVGNDTWEIASYVEEDELGLMNIVMQEGITDVEGKYLFEHLEYNTVYRLTETKAPAGYVLDTTPRYFYYKNDQLDKGPEPENFSSLKFVNTTSDGDCVHYHFTNTERDVEKTSISVNKVWNFGYSGLQEAPVEEVYYHVYQIATTVTGEAENQTTEKTEKWYGMYPVTKANGWESTIHNLPSQTSDGKTTYSYYVKEVSVPGFDSTYSVDKDHPATGAEGEEPIVITNTANPYLFYTSLNVEKKWYESDGRTQIANPETEKVTFLLYQRTTRDRSRKTGFGTPVLMGQYTLTKDNQWKWSRMGLVYEEPVFDYSNWMPQYLYTLYYDYYLVETPVEGYTSDVEISSGQNDYFYYTNATITNTKDPTTSVSLEKKWYDEDGTTALTNPPVNEITVQLQRMTKFMSGWENYGDPITVTKDMNWQYTVAELPMYDNSRNIYYYRFVETEIDGFKTEYTFDYTKVEGDYEEIAGVTGVGNGGKVVIHNKKLETTSLVIRKSWKDAAGEMLESVDETSITVHIFRQLGDDATTKQEYKTVTITPDENGNWSYTQTDLPKEDSQGTAYVYTVEETAVPNFTTKYTPDYDESGVLTGYTITNQQRTGFTTIQVDKEWAMLDGTGTPPEGASVTFDLYQRSTPEGWTGDAYLDTATAEPVTVQYSFGGETHAVQGYPGETVNLILRWEKKYDTDNIQYADPQAYADTDYKTITCVKSDETENGALFTAAFTIPENVSTNSAGNRIVNLYTNGANNDRWSYVDLVLIPTARETKIGTYTMPNAQGQWSTKISPLVASAEIGGVTIDYTYFVEETAVSGFNTSYTNNGGITGGNITMTNTERDIYTDLSVNKVWSSEVETVPESITYELHRVTSTTPGNTSEVEMVNVSFEIKDENNNVWNHANLAGGTYPKGTVLNVALVSSYTESQNMSWCTAVVNDVTYASGAGVQIIDGHPGYVFEITLNENMVISGKVSTTDLFTNWTPVITSGSTILADDVVQTVELTASNWSNTHENLPTEGQLNNATVYYSYYVKEIKVGDTALSESGFVGITSKDEDGNITITNRPDDSKTSLAVSKVWAEGEGVDGSTVTHGDVSVKIYRTINENQDPTVDELVDTLTFGASGATPWSAVKEGLPIADEDGNVYDYYVKEVEVSGYTSAVAVNETEDGSFSFTITNTAKEGNWTSLTVDKAWKNVDGTAYTPTSEDQVKLTLMQVVTGSSTTDSADMVTVTLNVKPNDSTDPVKREISVASGSKVTIELVSANGDTSVTCGNTDIERKSVEQDSDYLHHHIYEYVVTENTTLNAYLWHYGDKAWDAVLTGENTGPSVTVAEHTVLNMPYTAEDGSLVWSHTFSRLPLEDADGTAYSYYVVEENGKMFNVSYGGVSEDAPVMEGTITVTNTVTSLDVNKVWQETDEGTAVEHGDVTVYVYRKAGSTKDEDFVMVLTLNDSCDWKSSVDNLPVADADGVNYTYYVEEAEVPGYTGTVSANQGSNGTWAFTITNTEQSTIPGETEITVKKQWRTTAGEEATPTVSEIGYELRRVTFPNNASYEACLGYADSDWNPQTQFGSSSNTKKTINGPGTYTLEWNPGTTVSGVLVFVVDIVGAESLLECYEITALSASVDGKDIPVTLGNAAIGDNENNGNFRIELYNEWGATKNAPAVDTSKLSSFNKLSVTFTISEKESLTERSSTLIKTGILSAENNWREKVTGLTEGAEYYVVETTDVPTCTVKYSYNGTEYEVSPTVQPGSIVTIINELAEEPRYELPHTGGGAAAVYLLGWMMTAGAGIGLVEKKRRKTR